MSEAAPTDNLIAERLRSIFPNESVANKVIDLVVSKRPPGWSRKAYAPYYKEFFALLIKKEIDKMIQLGDGIIYRYDIFCDESKGGMSKNTLYLKVNQSIHYLCDNLDTDNRYKQWRDLTLVRRDKDRGGITIEYIPDFQKNERQGFRGESIMPSEQSPSWRKRMDDWLESDNNLPFVQERIGLTAEQVQTLREELRSLAGIQAMVSFNTIKIIRVNV